MQAEIRLLHPDIVCISETWVSSDSDSDSFSFNDYVSFADCRVGRRGGGVMMLLKANLQPVRATRALPNRHQCNAVSVFIGAAKQKTLISCVYRPPDTNVVDSDALVQHLSSLRASTDVHVITGDFNYPRINWEKPALTRRDGIHNVFQSATDDMGLTQCVQAPTCNNHILDLILLSHPITLVECKCLPPVAGSDHQAISLNMHIDRKDHRLDSAQPDVNFDRADIHLASALLSSVNWSNVFAHDRHVDEYVRSFMDVLSSVLIQASPVVRCRKNQPRHTIPRHIRALILKKRRLWKKISDEPSRDAYRATCKAVKKAMRVHTSSREQALVEDHNQAAFYKYVNSALGCPRRPIQLVDADGNCVQRDNVAEVFSIEFAKNFSSPPTPPNSAPAPDREEDLSSETPINITLSDVYKVLSQSPSSAPGPDRISGSVLRRLAPVLALPTSIIFQQSVAQGVFPSSWKTAVVVPIYKGKGLKNAPSSYRPVSLCLTFGKALERLVKDYLLAVINERGGLNKAQHGFVNCRSTITNLLVTEHIVADAINAHQALDIISFDFSRAFDRVPHNLLLQELTRRGVTGKALCWLESFLTGRSQVVRTSGMSSSPAAVTSGVIQGSCLGPALFTIYMDSLISQIDIPATAYADDLKFAVNLARHKPEAAQANVDKVYSWSVRMGMPLSLSKSMVIHYGLNNPHYRYRCGEVNLPASNSFADLGIGRSSDGLFREHAAVVAQKGRRLTGLCLRAMPCRDPQFMLRVYKSHILPVLCYASCIWSPYLKYEIDDLEQVQRKFTKRLTGQRHLSYGQRLSNLSLLSLESTRIEADMILVYKILHGLMDITPEDAGLNLCKSNTRGGGLRLLQPRASTAAAASLFPSRASSQWNSLPLDIIKPPSLSLFKVDIRQWLHAIDLAYFL